LNDNIYGEKKSLNEKLIFPSLLNGTFILNKDKKVINNIIEKINTDKVNGFFISEFMAFL
jgi:hypothetical protein